jgi:osmotically-inducible protein OsmY
MTMLQDELLAAHVGAELEQDADVDADHIAVRVHHGAVTLSGTASSYREKRAALRAAERVYALQAVADEIEVLEPDNDVEDDTLISEALEQSFRSHGDLPRSVRAVVRGGVVTLSGRVDWERERRQAEQLAGRIRGVDAVTNLITVAPHALASDVQHRVSETLRRFAAHDAHSVTVTTHNGTVHLYGHVHSRRARDVAESAAFSAPGVTAVENKITLAP